MVLDRGMAFTPAQLEMVDHHIAQGERHVARQLELVEWLKSRGHPTDLAEQLLADFQSTLNQRRAHRELMLMEIEGDPLRPSGRAKARPRAKPSRKQG